MRNLKSKRINKIRAVVLILFLSIFLGGIFYSRTVSESSAAATEAKTIATPPRRKTKSKTKKTQPETQVSKQKFTEFPHDKHQLDCDSCHKFPSPNWEKVRSADAFPDITDYPRHESCLDCHREQFFSGAPPAICTICHTNPSPDDSSRHPFPNPREIFDASPKGKTAVSDFQIFFPHDKHIDIVSQNETEKTLNGARFVNARMNRAAEQSESCAVCHQTYKPQGDSADEYFTKPPAKLGDAFWLKKGTFKTAPVGHQTCFTCHSADSGILPAPTNCATCHKPDVPLTKTDFDPKAAETMKLEDKIMLLAWRGRDSSATFRHEFSSHAEMDCATCHNVTAMNTTDPLTKKVAVASCNMCHITATADDGGILNFEVDARKKDAKFQCVKCHIAYGKLPIPESHLKAISDAK